MRTFANPIIPGFHADPSICRVGREFYLVNSSFEYFPGVPIFHSRDLVSWKQIGHVLTRKSQLDLKGVRSSGGIYAPTIRHASGRFYMIATNVDGGGNFFVTAERPEGPWSDPIWLDREGIDPSLSFFDDSVFYTRNGKGPDRDHPLIYQTTIDPRTGKLSDEPTPIWSGLGGIWPEGPHLYKIGRWYYLLTAEGGTGYDHSIVIARSRWPDGPFEGCPHNPILTHRNHPRHAIQATGHADLIELADGSWWTVFLGVRPNRGRAGARYHHLGRETFLAPVIWTKDRWPVIGAKEPTRNRQANKAQRDKTRSAKTRSAKARSAKTRADKTGIDKRGRVEIISPAPDLTPAPWVPPAVRDDFDATTLSPVWNFLRNPHARDWSLTKRPGHLRLLGSGVTLDDIDSPALVLRRQQHFQVRCRTLLDFSPRGEKDEAGLTVRANENFHLDLVVVRSRGSGRADRQVLLRARTRGVTREMARVRVVGEGPVHLQIEATRRWYAFSAGIAGAAPDAAPGVTHVLMRSLGKLPTEALSSENVWAFGQNYFTGAFFGLYASGNGRRSKTPADFDWFDYLPR